MNKFKVGRNAVDFFFTSSEANGPEAIIERVAERYGMTFHEARQFEERHPKAAKTVATIPTGGTSKIRKRWDTLGRQIINGVRDLNGPENSLSPEDRERFNRSARMQANKRSPKTKASDSDKLMRNEQSRLNLPVRASASLGMSGVSYKETPPRRTFGKKSPPDDDFSSEKLDRESIMYGATTPRYGGLLAPRGDLENNRSKRRGRNR